MPVRAPFFFLVSTVAPSEEHRPPHRKPHAEDQAAYNRPRRPLQHRHRHHQLPRGLPPELPLLLLLRPDRPRSRRHRLHVAISRVQRGPEGGGGCRPSVGVGWIRGWGWQQSRVVRLGGGLFLLGRVRRWEFDLGQEHTGGGRGFGPGQQPRAAGEAPHHAEKKRV